MSVNVQPFARLIAGYLSDTARCTNVTVQPMSAAQSTIFSQVFTTPSFSPRMRFGFHRALSF